MRYLIAIIFFFTASASFAAPPTCGPRDNMVSKLKRVYKEIKTGMGVNSRGSLIEIYASRHGGFTVLTTGPTGFSCIAATGKHWETLNKHWSVKSF